MKGQGSPIGRRRLAQNQDSESSNLSPAIELTKTPEREKSSVHRSSLILRRA